MTRKLNRLVRMAVAIHENVLPKQQQVASVVLPSTAWQQCEMLQNKIKRVSKCGWQLATGRLRRDLRLAIGRLQDELIEAECQIEPARDLAPRTQQPSYRRSSV